MSKGKSLAALTAIVLAIVLVGVLSMTGFPVSSTSYVMPVYKGMQMGAESTGLVAATFHPQMINENVTDFRMDKTVAAMRGRLNMNGFTDAKVMRVGKDGIRVEYSVNYGVNHDPYTEMLAKESNLRCFDPDGNLIFDSTNIVAVQPGMDQLTSKYGITFQLDTKGTSALKKVTQDRTGENMLVQLNNETIAALQIDQPITTGQTMITQDEMTEEAAIELAMEILGGPLPFAMVRADLTYLEGAVPKADMHRTVLVALLALLVAAIVLIPIYRLNGAAAAIALAVYALLTLLAVSTMESIRVSTASVAGIAAAMIIAFSSILILLEATNTEMMDGKSAAGAVAGGLSRSFGVLLDLHIMVAAIALVCFFLGQTWLRDAATTLLIGLAFDVFAMIGVLYGCQHLFANAFDPIERFTRFGKTPEAPAIIESGKKKKAKKA